MDQPVNRGRASETLADQGSRLLAAGFTPSDPPTSGDRDPLDRVAEEFADRCRRGEAPAVAEYEARFPDQAERVRKLLGAVAMMEQLRRGSKQARFMPERIGEFRVLRELGRGGMGVVYEAVQESLWRHVAVKAIHHTQLDMKRLQRFQREARAVAQLHHTNIVPIFGVGEHEGIPYYAMQYIKGRGLDALLETWRTETPPPTKADRWRLAARFAAQTAEALNYAHEQGVLHRDIKPANLLIDEHDAVWVTDFGLAKMSGHEELTASGDVIGTLRYLAPESLRGVSEPRGDVYSLGLTLYETITLAAPFGDLTPSELLHRVSAGQPVRPRQVDPTIPRDLETIILKATARDLKDRYATAGLLAEDLHCFLNDRPIQARRANFVERAWRWSRRNRGTAALSALAIASLLLAAIVGWIGYVQTNRALLSESRSLELSRANVSFLNKLFEEMFDTIAPEVEAEAELEGLLTQPLIAAQATPGGPSMFAEGSSRHGRPGPVEGFDDRHRGPGFGRPPHGDEPGGGPGMEPTGPLDLTPGAARTRSFALLKRLMTSYDEFAQSQSNKTNVVLQCEAAYVYYKMGTLYDRFQQRDEADQAFERSLKTFDDLAIEYGRVPVYQHKFVQVCAAIKPWHRQSVLLEAVERRLVQLNRTIDRLLAVSPGHAKYLRARLQLLAKLGLVRYQLDQPRYEELFLQALDLADTLVKVDPEAGDPHSDRSDVLEAYAIVLEHQGNLRAARDRLNAAMEELEWVAADGLRSLAVATRMESLADDFERIDEPERSAQIQRRADEIDPRPPLLDRPKPGLPFGSRRLDAGESPTD